jgi:GxxExxY protein
MQPKYNDALTERIIGCAIRVHRALGPGLLESAYHRCLAHELSESGLKTAAEVPLPIRYNGIILECGYRIDLLIEDTVILELKAVEKVLPLHQAQLLSYMKLARIKTGLLINFHVQKLTNGIKRMKL